MKRDDTPANQSSLLRYGMLVPLALMITSVISCCFSYSNAKQNIANDLNDAMFALANANSELWTRPDTIAAIRKMYETTHKPMIYLASDVNFRNTSLKDKTYFTIALADKKYTSPEIPGSKIASDSIMLIPARGADGPAIQVRGFAECSMASIFIASDKKLPSILFIFSILSMSGIFIWKRRTSGISETELVSHNNVPSLDGIKLTPMQRQFARMLLDAPNMKVDKRTLCKALWGNKSNAEESLYTLVRRTKTALAKGGMEIICNRGDSYELRVND